MILHKNKMNLNYFIMYLLAFYVQVFESYFSKLVKKLLGQFNDVGRQPYKMAPNRENSNHNTGLMFCYLL